MTSGPGVRELEAILCLIHKGMAEATGPQRYLPVLTAQALEGSFGAGPNGGLVTPENILWAGDSDSTLQVVDLNRTPPQIIKSILIGKSADGRRYVCRPR
jgi:hypothetical protein